MRACGIGVTIPGGISWTEDGLEEVDEEEEVTCGGADGQELAAVGGRGGGEEVGTASFDNASSSIAMFCSTCSTIFIVSNNSDSNNKGCGSVDSFLVTITSMK